MDDEDLPTRYTCRTNVEQLLIHRIVFHIEVFNFESIMTSFIKSGRVSVRLVLVSSAAG